MASSYSDLKVELIGTGEQVGSWGSTTNTNLSTALGEAIAGSADVTFASADVDLTLVDSNGTQTARNYRLNLTGTSGGARNLYLSTGANIKKPYIINNGLADDVTVRNKIGGSPSGASVVVPAGKTLQVYNTGTDVVEVQNYTAVASGGTGRSTLTSNNVILGNGTSPVQFVAPGSIGNVLRSNGTTWSSGAVPAGGSTGQVQFNSSGDLLGSANFTYNAGTGAVTATSFSGQGSGLTALSADNVSSGTLVVARGGTGANSLASGGILRGNNTSAISVAAAADIVSAIGSTAVTNATNAVNATNATNASNILGGAANRIVYNTGSGSTAFITAPTVTSSYLQWDGSGFTWSTISGSGVLSVTGSGAGISVTGSSAVTVSNTGVTSFNSRTSAVSLLSSDVTSALGYTPYNGSTNPNNYVTSSALSGYATTSSNTFTGTNIFWDGVYLNSGATGRLIYTSGAIQNQISGSTYMNVTSANTSTYKHLPFFNNNSSLGDGSFRWTEVFAINGSINTSDQRLKTDITTSNLGLSFINRLRPVYFRWIVGHYDLEKQPDGSFKPIPVPGVRHHYGMISQEVKAALDAEGVTNFGGWCLNDPADPDSLESLRYTEFISPMIKAIQELSARVQTLEAEVTALKGA